MPKRAQPERSESNEGSEGSEEQDEPYPTGMFFVDKHGLSETFWIHEACPEPEELKELIVEQGGNIVEELELCNFALFPNNYEHLERVEDARAAGQSSFGNLDFEKLMMMEQERIQSFQLGYQNYQDIIGDGKMAQGQQSLKGMDRRIGL